MIRQGIARGIALLIVLAILVVGQQGGSNIRQTGLRYKKTSAAKASSSHLLAYKTSQGGFYAIMD